MKQTRGLSAHPTDQLWQREEPWFNQFGDCQTKGGLQPHDAEWRVVELAFLHLVMMWGMVGRDCIDRAIRQPPSHSVHIVLLPKRWVHLGIGVVAVAGRVGEREVVGCRLRGDVHSPLLAAVDQIDRSSG